MDHTPKTTEFSTHLSRSRVRRYLHEQLGPEETRQVEVHLAHCAQCSASLVNYIETEEADQYNTYAKRLKGKLKEQKIAKRQLLSSFQVRALRATAAVIALFIFSFFGVKTIINKEVTHYKPDTKTAETKKKPALSSQKKPSKAANTEKASETKSDKRLAENRPTKAKPSSQTATKKVAPKVESSTKKAPVKPKPASEEPTPKQDAPVQKEVIKKVEEPKTVAAKDTPKEETTPVEEKAEAPDKIANMGNDTETTEESSAKEVPAPIKTLPTVKKMDNSKNLDAAAPASSKALPVIPIPSGELR